MAVRLFFSDSCDRENFFNSVLEHSGYASWRKFTKTLCVGSHDLWVYRVGKYCISESLFAKLVEFIPNNERAFWIGKLSKKDSNWGQVKGGKIMNEMHPEILAEGRKKAVQKNFTPKYDFDINLDLNKGIAEFVGAFIGDGCTGKYWNKNKFIYQTKFTGDSLLDLDYYKSVLFPITKQNFGFDKLHISSRDNSIVLNLSSKRLYEFWTERLNMPSGLKFDKVLIPKEILCDSALLAPCIRGIFDTDG
ncbi:MAG: hypothetical protein NUV57_05920, partial [archaeon]|nr:hypothetical protein [archaeon]